MNSLAIIGNGFDISHGLKTSYLNFASTLSDDLKIRWEEVLSESDVNPDNWYSFEEVIDELTRKWYEDYLDTVVGNSSIFTKEELLHKIEKINTIFSIMTEKLFEYISIENKKKIILKENIQNRVLEDTPVINFNYTSTAECYSTKVYYIHGSIDEGAIVLGYKLRHENIGIMNEATEFNKSKLREQINFRRYLKNKGLKDEEIDIELKNFKTHLLRIFNGRGGYVFDYSDETDKQINQFINNYYKDNWDSKEEFSRFRSRRIPKLPDEIERIAREERVSQISELINQYGEMNGFSPSSLNTGVRFEEIEELIILGHSLVADEEIVRDIINELVQLKKIILFVYYGENFTDKENFLKSVSSCPIEIVYYD